VSTGKTRFSDVLKNTRTLSTVPEPDRAPAEPVRKVGRPPGKKSNPAYRQVTVYVRDDVHRDARKLLLDERRQFSDLVNELVDEWVRKKRPVLEKSGR
jgi:hypothetical protein